MLFRVLGPLEVDVGGGLPLFAIVGLAAPRLSILAMVLGVGFPIVLLAFLGWRHGGGGAARMA